jgi:hypothetical protein
MVNFAKNPRHPILLAAAALIIAAPFAAQAQQANLTPVSIPPREFVASAPIKSVEPFNRSETVRTAAADFDRRKFWLASTTVYAFAFLDMHQTMSLRPHINEHDPLARPFVKLPEPAYYASGIALATGVNWLGWKLGHGRRLHRVWWLPQALTVAGNSFGYSYTLAH